MALSPTRSRERLLHRENAAAGTRVVWSGRSSALLALGNEQELRVVFGKEHVVKRDKALTLGAYLDMLERRAVYECTVVDMLDCFGKGE